MRISYGLFPLFILLCTLLIVQPTTFAQTNKVVTSNQQAGQLAKKNFGGKVLKVQSSNKKSVYMVKILQDNGHVISVKIDANSGKLSKR